MKSPLAVQRLLYFVICRNKFKIDNITTITYSVNEFAGTQKHTIPMYSWAFEFSLIFQGKGT